VCSWALPPECFYYNSFFSKGQFSDYVSSKKDLQAGLSIKIGPCNRQLTDFQANCLAFAKRAW
jgi:hypothetical protein